MKNKTILKKLLAIVLVFAMLAPIMGNFGTNAGLVQAAEEEETVGYEIVAASDVTESTVDGVKVYTSSTYKDYVFAGWYKDENATEVAYSSNDRAYARFLPEGVLSTKVQVTNGVVTDTANETYNGKYVMRFVSSVDSIDYKYAGFELSWTDKTTNESEKRTSMSYTAFKRIDSTTGATDNDVDTYEFSPKVIDTKSEYFVTAKWPVAEEDKAVNYTVKAYWMTKDGTKVYGKERCVSVEDGAGTTAETRLNLTVGAELDQEYSYSVSYENWSKGNVTSSNVEVLTTGKGYSNIRIKTADRDTKSVTTITITSADDSSTYTTTYRNLYSKYEDEDGNTKFDTSWYSASEDEYIIATRADMYGFANLVDGGESKYPFANKKVYLVSDIALNPEVLELLEGDNYLKWYTYDSENQKVYQDSPSHTWNPIGAGTTNAFNGTFDGQGHTLSGLYLNMTSSDNNAGRYGGLFSQINETASVKNIKLKSSHLKTVQYDIGSIAGVMKGTIDTVYSDAIVECNGSRSGGMVGQLSGSDAKMTNCWFAGRITNKLNGAQGTGGLVGVVINSAKLTMENCFNSGIVDVSAGVSAQPYAGGLIGQVGQGEASTLVLEDSLNVGEIKYYTGHTTGYGSCVGMVRNNASSRVSTTYGADGCGRVFAVESTTGVDFNNQTPTKVTADIKGTNAQTNMPKLGWNNTWTTVAHGIPVLSVFEKEVFDTSWYDEDNVKSVYVLKDKGDLYGLAKLSEEYNFEGITIQLANDIIVNTGNAEDWAAGTDVPYYNWTPIGPSTLAFKGTFNANMHTISGLYLESTARYGGLFATTAGTTSTPTIQNLSLKNSYLKTTNTSADFGSVVGRGCGTFDSIYSDAIVVVQGDRAGGVIGQINVASTMNNCWYAGDFINNGDSARYHGGLVGYISANLTMTNCLNTGTIKTSTSTKRGMTGGLMGFVYTGAVVNVSSCMNVGLIQQAATETSHYGPIVGYNSGTMNITKASTYAIKESSRSHYGSNIGTNADTLKYKNVSETDILNAAEAVVGVLGETVWTTVAYKTPVLKSFKNESDGRIDVSWFDETTYDSTTEYTLYDEEDLYGFARISKEKDFSGKTVKLGAGIVVNEGTASAEWATTSNYRYWTPIGSIASGSKVDFMGTFDGQGHTISGLYLDTTWQYAGLFASVGSDGIVQNVKLTNSYLKSTGKDFGGISGVGAGKYYNIYNSAIMSGKHWTNGGFVGLTNGDDVVLEKCWFAGTLTNEYNPDTSNTEYHQGTGGLVGLVYSGKVTMTNCMNSGGVSLPEYNKSKTRTNTDTNEEENYVCSNVGGLIGSASAEVTMHGCLNTGVITYNSDVALTLGYGPLVGFSANKGNVSMSATYATDSLDIDDPRTINNTTANYEVVAEADVKSDAATTMPLLSWGNDWTAVSGALPEIKFDYTISVSGLDVAATAEEQELLADNYNGRLLYQGEMHDHAETYGRGPELLPGDDGTVSLTTWEEQMQTLGLDFAASLDHNQIDHIDREDWDESKFVYGSEASATIKDDTGTTTIGELHFDMIFKTKAQFQSIIDKYSSKFNYDTTAKLFSYTGLVFTKTEFKTFIKDIMQVGGVFNLPHPLQNDSYNATGLEDYYFEVIDESQKQLIYGFQVFRGNTSNPDTLTNYEAWVDMLSKGYRIYATAGSDSHGDLNVNTLTSIYATTCQNDCTGTCENSECTGYDKGNLIPQLASGDFAAGSVGIQMSIGSTLMGGSCDFTTNKRLVIGIGEIHTGKLVDGHKYRVEVLNEDGVVYSQQIATDGTTKIALDTTECDFYRVEVYDGTTGVRIAIGNPIWNDK